MITKEERETMICYLMTYNLSQIKLELLNDIELQELYYKYDPPKLTTQPLTYKKTPKEKVLKEEK